MDDFVACFREVSLYRSRWLECCNRWLCCSWPLCQLELELDFCLGFCLFPDWPWCHYFCLSWWRSAGQFILTLERPCSAVADVGQETEKGFFPSLFLLLEMVFDCFCCLSRCFFRQLRHLHLLFLPAVELQWKQVFYHSSKAQFWLFKSRSHAKVAYSIVFLTRVILLSNFCYKARKLYLNQSIQLKLNFSNAVRLCSRLDSEIITASSAWTY